MVCSGMETPWTDSVTNDEWSADAGCVDAADARKLEVALRNLLGTIDAHEIESLSCDLRKEAARVREFLGIKK